MDEKRPARITPIRNWSTPAINDAHQEAVEAHLADLGEDDRRQAGGRSRDRERRPRNPRHHHASHHASDEARHRRHAARDGDPQAQGKGNEKDNHPGDRVLLGVTEHGRVVMHDLGPRPRTAQTGAPRSTQTHLCAVTRRRNLPGETAGGNAAPLRRQEVRVRRSAPEAGQKVPGCWRPKRGAGWVPARKPGSGLPTTPRKWSAANAAAPRG